MSSVLAFPYAPQQAWGMVFAKVKRAVVFMDDACAESLHWTGGAVKLFEAGAVDVKAFSSFEAGAANQPKAVFVVSTLLKGKTADVIKDIISLSAFRYSIVITAVAHSVHLFASNISVEAEGYPLFEQFEEKLCEWMGNMNYTAEVMHASLLFCPLSSHLLSTPALSRLFPLIPEDVNSINRTRPDKKKFTSFTDVDFGSLPDELQISIRVLVSSLSAMLDILSIKEECFAVGPTSRIIASELANSLHCKNRRKVAQNKASLLFIDRTLDLTGPVGHHGDSLAEKILSTLPSLPGHNSDVMVDMMELTCLRCDEETRNIIAPGCLAQPNDPAASVLWESMLNLKHKEGVMEVRRHLVETASKENLPIKMTLGRVTPEQLSSYILLFKNNFRALEDHCGILQLSLATVQTIKHPDFCKSDSFLAFERLLLQVLGDSGLHIVLRQMLPMIKTKKERRNEDLNGSDILVLLVYIYSLTNEILESSQLDEAEWEVKKALVNVIHDEISSCPLLQRITGCSSFSEMTSEKSQIVVDKMFETLRGITRNRAHLKQLRSVYTPGDNVHQGTYKPMLKQIVEEIYRVDRSEPSDIEHMSAGLTELLKTGFSMFMKVSRPHPSDHPVLILFVVGGVTPSEGRLIKEIVSSQKLATQVVVLTTRLLRPTDIPELLFATDRLHPDIGV
ncbi:sec1 family domain-containing protein 2 [Polypterus senegalus]|uniref:sec1 family domain-containing protein 2 n=1 Tax=Polypterus senegalus TaxID=55291 RepID=UPI0019649D77|nr:sec1 family domain-containing protein 2 [Polypterus senegalus]